MAEREAVTGEELGALYAQYRVSLSTIARNELFARGVPESVVSAEDIVQDAFAKALRNPASIENPIPYLRVVIRAEVANRARQQVVRARLEARRAADPLRFDPMQSADIAALIANRCAIEQALAGLSLPQRTAVWATKALDCTQGETAALMDRAPGTVATHVSRGMALLRSSLAAAVVATIVILGGRHFGGGLQHGDPANRRGDSTVPTSWWNEGRALLNPLYEQWPVVAWISIPAACCSLWWLWCCMQRRSATCLNAWLRVRRTGQTWLRTMRRWRNSFGTPRVTRDRLSSLQDCPNTRLQDLLSLAGWSRGELAGLVNRRAAAVGHPQLATDTSRVRRWIDMGESPREPVPTVLAALFTERLGRVVTVEDLGFGRPGRARKRRDVSSAERANPDGLPWAPERTAAVLTEFTGMDLMLNRRGMVGAGAALAAGSALRSGIHDWQQNDPEPTQQADDQAAADTDLGALDAQCHHAIPEALKILETLTHSPQGVVTRAQLARSLRAFGSAESAALSMLIRQGYVQGLPGSKYTLGQGFRSRLVSPGTEKSLLLPARSQLQSGEDRLWSGGSSSYAVSSGESGLIRRASITSAVDDDRFGMFVASGVASGVVRSSMPQRAAYRMRWLRDGSDSAR
ncbi:RNA polymerase sigma factor [Streptomyces sp. NPDC091416]|uniref:RNA polymerase sigma factor n=1 Tax=Streptomyces sp. NPDC091416 TaxID=3366003 RepID=UPI00382F3A7A